MTHVKKFFFQTDVSRHTFISRLVLSQQKVLFDKVSICQHLEKVLFDKVSICQHLDYSVEF